MSENMQQEFPAYYTALCARVADAIDALEQQNYGAARDALISGMQEAEETAQLWEILCGVLDQFVEILGDEKLSADEFLSLIHI